MLINIDIDYDLLQDHFDHLFMKKTTEVLIGMYFDNGEVPAIGYEGYASKENIKDWLLESDDEELQYFNQLINAEIRDRKDEDETTLSDVRSWIAEGE